MSEPSSAQRSVAVRLGLPPDKPETWPMQTIDRLVALREAEGEAAYFKEIHDMMTRPLVIGPLQLTPEPDRELLTLTLTCLSKAIDDRPGSLPLIRELLAVLKCLNNPQMRLQADMPTFCGSPAFRQAILIGLAGRLESYIAHVQGSTGHIHDAVIIDDIPGTLRAMAAAARSSTPEVMP